MHATDLPIKTPLTMKTVFGGHETFVFRHGWLKKGFDGVTQNPAIFSKDKGEALVMLGVGKNMVSSIRHWTQALGLLNEVPGQARALAPTNLGAQLLDDGGWDPYLEDPGSLWLLHWLLCSNRVRSWVWGLCFSRFHEASFTKKQLVRFVVDACRDQQIRTTEGILEREVDCFLRTYVPSRRGRGAPGVEDAIECPLADLDLIRLDQVDDLYSFVVGPKATLPVEIFAFALVEFLEGRVGRLRTVPVDDCLYRPGSPGQIFRLDENSVIEGIEAVAARSGERIQYDETSGLRQIYIPAAGTPLDGSGPDGLFSALKMEFLQAYYR